MTTTSEHVAAELGGAPAEGIGGGPPRRLRWVGALAPVALVALWALLSALGVLRPVVFPGPARVASTLWDFFAGEQRLRLAGVVPFTGAGWSHLGASLSRCLITGAVAIAAGVAAGVGLGRSRVAAALLDPLLGGLRAVPLYAWLPLLIVWLGIGEPSARGLIFLGALWPTLVATADAVARVPAAYTETARMLGTPRGQLWRRVHLPAALPEVVTGVRLSLTLAWACVVVGELTGTATGIGAMMNAARETGRVDEILVGVLLFAVVGAALDGLVRLGGRRLTGWAAA